MNFGLGKGTNVIARIPIRPGKQIIGGDDAEDGFLNRAKAVLIKVIFVCNLYKKQSKKKIAMKEIMNNE